MSAVEARDSAWALDVCVALAVAALVAIALLTGPEGWGGRDWDKFQADLIAARRSLLELRELPFWFPFRIGGHDAWADPQSVWCSPLGLCVLALGPLRGCQAFLVLVAGAAALGMARLLAELRLEPPARAVGAVLVGLGPVLGLFAAGGIPTFSLALAALPWLLLCVLRGTRWSAIAGGALLALVFYGGGVNHIIFHGLFVAWVGLLLLVGDPPTRRRERLVCGVLLFAAAGVIAAPKLVPAALLAREHPRSETGRGRGALTWALLRPVLLERSAVRFVEQPYAEFVLLDRAGRLVNQGRLEDVRPETVVDWVDHGAYLGWVALLLALLGLGALGGAFAARGPPELRGPPRRWLAVLVAGGLLMLWLAWGTNAGVSPWRALKQLPVFASLRSPGRLVLYPWFVLVLLASVGAQIVLSALRARSAPLALACGLLIPFGLALDVYPPARRAYRQAFTEADVYRALPAAERFTSVLVPPLRGTTYYGSPVSPFVRKGYAVVNGYTVLPLPRAAVARQDTRYTGEAFLVSGTAELGGLRVTSRQLSLPARAETAATVILNQNFASGWSVSRPNGAVVRRHDDGRLAVDLPAGSKQLRLRYTPPGLWVGLVALLLGLPLLLLLVRRSPVSDPVSP